MSFFTHATSNNDGTVEGNVTERMRIDSAGNVKIGSATTGAPAVNADDLVIDKGASESGITIMSTAAASIRFGDAANTAIGSIEYNHNSNYMRFSANNSEKMRITSDGDLLIGTTGEPNGTSVYGSAFTNETSGRMLLRMASSTSGPVNLAQFSNPNGVIGKIQTSASATSFITTSDYRLKEDLQDFKGLDLVSKIPVYDYKWKADESRSYGVMAHELEEVLPQAVSGEKDAEEMQSVDYSKIVPLLVKSIQELKAEIELLKNK